MSKEALRTQLDTLRMEKDRLEAENTRLRDSHSAEAARIDAEAEVTRLSELVTKLEQEKETANRTADAVGERIEELMETAQSLREEIARLSEALGECDAEREHLQAKVHELEKATELERLRAAEEERRKWEAREERLLRQITLLEVAQEKRSDESEMPGTTRMEESPAATPPSLEHTTGEPRAGLGESLHGAALMSSVVAPGASVNQPHPPIQSPLIHPAREPSFCPPAYIAHQLPPLAPFKGDMEPDSETVDEWLERFAMLAEECQWTPRAKLLHLTSRLEKQAYAFYRSCSPQKKASYDLLIAELRKRFTPVRIQGVDTSLFHERKQGEGESVDQYAQALRRLHQKAYPESLQGSEDAERMGRTLLASQFVSGLKPAIKRSVTGSEQPNDIELLLTKARFEEAKLRELEGVELSS